MYYGHNPKFPDNFMWGASSAAWQVEGGVADGGRTPAIIDLNSKTKKPFADNTYAADHYHHYKEDVALMAECGFSSYRFSLSWSRIIPHADGKVNPEGIAFYNDLINELVAHNITPIVTLYHYDLPVWVDELGGWKSRDTVERFEHYCRVCFENFGDRLRNSGRRNSDRAFMALSRPCSVAVRPKPTEPPCRSEPALDVMTMTVFSKFTTRPCESVMRPSSRI